MNGPMMLERPASGNETAELGSLAIGDTVEIVSHDGQKADQIRARASH